MLSRLTSRRGTRRNAPRLGEVTARRRPCVRRAESGGEVRLLEDDAMAWWLVRGTNALGTLTLFTPTRRARLASSLAIFSSNLVIRLSCPFTSSQGSWQRRRRRAFALSGCRSTGIRVTHVVLGLSLASRERSRLFRYRMRPASKTQPVYVSCH